MAQRAAWSQGGLRALPVASAILLAAIVVSSGMAAPAPFPVIGKRAPNFLLIDQDDHRVQVSQFRGKLVLLNFIYTHCTDVCPLTTAALARVQHELMHRGWWTTDVVFLTITTDPLHDTPMVLRTYATRYKADIHGWHFLTGDPGATQAVYQQYGIAVQARSRNLQDHASPTFVIDRDGVVLGAYGTNLAPDAIIHDLAQLRARG
ncbi:MAG TPA: SCO family protein [bacterium]|nr:SCO family protein [bacterium]